jgi:uncharacterized protein (DUF934 family)
VSSALIRDGRIEEADDAVFVPLAQWPEHRGEPHVGVLLEPADDPATLQADLASIPAIAVNFPKFTDGRGYSIAFLLRKRFGYRGELRAVGDVQRDQFFYMQRAGFNAFLLKDGKDPQSALTSLRDFTTPYQTSADGRAPVFRLRTGAPR